MTWGDQLISCPTTMEVPELERRPYLDSESFRQTIADVPSFCLQAEMPINEKQQKFLLSFLFLFFPFYANSVLWASFLPSSDIVVDGQRKLGFLPSATLSSTANVSWASFLCQTSSSTATSAGLPSLLRHRRQRPASAGLPSFVDIVVDGTASVSWASFLCQTSSSTVRVSWASFLPSGT